MSTTTAISKMTVIFHWAIAVAVILSLSLGLYMVTLPKAPWAFQLYDLHNSIGVTIFFVALLQIYWRMRTGWPAPVNTEGAVSLLFKRSVHWILVISTAMLPLSGFLARVAHGYGVKLYGIVVVPFDRMDNIVPYPTLAEFATNLHYIGGRLLIAALAIHLVASLKHHFWDRDPTLTRMLGRIAN